MDWGERWGKNATPYMRKGTPLLVISVRNQLMERGSKIFPYNIRKQNRDTAKKK